MPVACFEIFWLFKFLTELDFFQNDAAYLHADITSAIKIATKCADYEHIKHIEVDCHSIRKALDNHVT